jgi:hypothetical protein
MTTKQLLRQLEHEGLRLASLDEAGWTYIYMDDNRERVTLWITDLGGER